MQKYGDGRVALIGFPSGEVYLLNLAIAENALCVLDMVAAQRSRRSGSACRQHDRIWNCNLQCAG